MALANQTDHLADSLTLPNSTNMTLAALQGVQVWPCTRISVFPPACLPAALVGPPLVL